MLFWNPDIFLVGIEIIDQQHMALFKTVNDIHTSYQKREGEEKLLELFEFLQQYVQMHFSDEQLLMEKAGYPNLAEQAAQHDYFIRELAQLRKRFEIEGDNLNLAIALLAKLGNWLVEHISIDDRKMGDYLKNRGGY